MVDVINNKMRLIHIKKMARTLAELRELCVDDADEVAICARIESLLGDLEQKKKKELRWSLVYNIKDGMASDLLFEGDEMLCKIYARNLINECPEYKDNLIISPAW